MITVELIGDFADYWLDSSRIVTGIRVAGRVENHVAGICNTMGLIPSQQSSTIQSEIFWY
jgi:hypothetical protein